LLLIAGLQSYYYGLRRGVVVTAAATAAYIAIAWTTIADVGWANMMIRLVMLVGTAAGVGLIGELEQAERIEAQRLRLEGIERERVVRDVGGRGGVGGIDIARG